MAAWNIAVVEERNRVVVVVQYMAVAAVRNMVGPAIPALVALATGLVVAAGVLADRNIVTIAVGPVAVAAGVLADRNIVTIAVGPVAVAVVAGVLAGR